MIEPPAGTECLKAAGKPALSTQKSYFLCLCAAVLRVGPSRGPTVWPDPPYEHKLELEFEVYVGSKGLDRG